VVYSRILTRVLPERCPSCGSCAHAGFCSGCRADFRRLPPPHVDAAPGRRRDGPDADARWFAAYAYVDPLKSQIQALKFSGQRHLGRALGLLLLAELATRGDTGKVDALIAMPLHRRRLIERGYNQAVEIARPIASAIARPLLQKGVQRRQPTRPQSDLSAAERRRNVAGAFRVRRRLDGLHIAIIDDVVTTGATAEALAREIAQAGAGEVSVWAVARSA
jgi:ComF family protein